MHASQEGVNKLGFTEFMKVMIMMMHPKKVWTNLAYWSEDDDDDEVLY